MIPTVIVGAGNMGSALFQGLSAKLGKEHLWLCDVHKEKLAPADPGRRLTDPRRCGEVAECILLAVKPQSFSSLMETVGRSWSKKLVISIMAGVTLRRLADGTGASAVVRAMPNLGARVGRCVTGWITTPAVTPAHCQVAERIFSAVGTSIRLDTESQIDAFTAIAGSGPAYFFYLAELLEQAARDAGISSEHSARIARDLLGAGSLLLDGGERSAADWRAAVTSKGGTTEAALRVLLERDFPAILNQALSAAAERSHTLSDDAGSH